MDSSSVAIGHQSQGQKSGDHHLQPAGFDVHAELWRSAEGTDLSGMGSRAPDAYGKFVVAGRRAAFPLARHDYASV